MVDELEVDEVDLDELVVDEVKDRPSGCRRGARLPYVLVSSSLTQPAFSLTHPAVIHYIVVR